MMNEFVTLSEEEREGLLRSVREDIDDYPIIPTFKQEEAIQISLGHGNMDFIAFTLDYQGTAEGGAGGERAVFHSTKPWSYATAGYSIQARSIHDALALVREIVENESGRHKFIYFRVEAPDMASPMRSYVDMALDVLEETEQELLRGNTLRWDLYDL